MADASINLALKFIDNATAPITSALSNIESSAKSAETALKLVVSALAIEKWYEFTIQVADLNSQYEQMSLKLNRLATDAKQLQDAMGWAKAFSLKTSFGTDDITSAMQVLLGAGKNPQEELDKYVDAARGSGVKLKDATSAVIKAVRGDFNDLWVNFGITAGVMEDNEDKIVFKFNNMGQQMHVIANNTAKDIDSALTNILAKFKGSNEAYQNSYSGILVTFSRQWTQFKAGIGEKDNLFPGIENGLRVLRDELGKLKSDGTLDILQQMIAGKITSGINIGLDLVEKLGNAAIEVYNKFSAYQGLAQYGLLGYSIFGVKGALIGALVGQYSDQAYGAVSNLVAQAYAFISSRPETAEWGLVGYALLGAKGAAIGALLGAYAPQVTAFLLSLKTSVEGAISSMGMADFGLVGYLLFGVEGALIGAALSAIIPAILGSTTEIANSVTAQLSGLGAVSYGIAGYFLFGIQGALVAAILGPKLVQEAASAETFISGIQSLLGRISGTEYGVLGYVLFGISGAIAGVALKNALNEAKGDLEGFITWIGNHPILTGFLAGGLKGAAAGAYLGMPGSKTSETSATDMAVDYWPQEPAATYGPSAAQNIASSVATALKAASSAVSEETATTVTSWFSGIVQKVRDGLTTANKSGTIGGTPVAGSRIGVGPNIATGSSGSGGRSGADPWGLEQLRGKIQQIEAEMRTMYREYHNEQYSFWEAEAASQGRFEDAAQLKNWQTLENFMANLAQAKQRALVNIQELEDKLSHKSGLTPEAIAAIELEKQKKQEIVDLDQKRADLALKNYEITQKTTNLKFGTELASVNVSYAQLTGTMEQQLKAQLALIDATATEKLGNDWRIKNLDKLGEAYRDLYLEQERQKKIDLGEYGNWEAFKQGIADATNAYETSAQTMRKAGKGLVTDLNSEFSSFFQKAFKGELKTASDWFSAFCTALENAFSKAISNMMADTLTSGLKSAFSGSGLGDLLGGLFGSGGSSSSGSFDASGAIIKALGLHSGGIVGNGGSTRLVSPLVFAGAPRLHSGLASDEFPAVLQYGEEVRSRRQVANDKAKSSGSGSARPVNVQVQIDNQSSTPLKLEQSSMTQNLDQVVIGIVAKDIHQYGVLGQMLKNRK